ncbi:MAG: PDZ domain-containing protein, partial [Erysipelotrichaceae bacterium]|nr:PDZ domain-containing protein [Erysipelotrichaceae bacterium]
DLILNGYVKGRPSIGIKCVSIESRRYMSYYNVSSYGVYVDEVTSQSAVTAGLRSGDLIIGIDDHEIASYTEMKNYLTEYKAGDMVKLTVLRGQEKVVLDIVLVEKKTN